jgi:TP901-1 family phage major tail protein
MNPIKGENLMIFVEEGALYGNASHALIALALATTCSLNFNVDSFDATSKDSGSWQASLPGMKSWSMSTDNLYCEASDKLLALAINRTPLKLYWCPAENTEALNQVTHDPALAVDGNDFMYYVGDAWINSYTANAANNEAANYTVNFTGTGALVPSNTLPDIGIGVSRSNVAMLAGGGTNVVVTNATGTLSATTSNVKLTTTIANGVVKINAAADCPAGAYIVTITDSGTGTTAYVFAVVSTT